ncbi:MAG: energy-coupling factor ABC transporter ATP-binding protein [Bacillota bacterium]|jgi:cobalt/nickel transport system ATP-binding protein
MAPYVLETANLEFSYVDGTKALNNLTMKIRRGKKVALVGSNGAGKTTLFLHFNGVHRPDKGEIRFNGEPVNYNSRELKHLRQSVGIVFQDPDTQLFSASVYQDVSFGPLNLGWPEEKVRRKVGEALNKTGTWELKDRPTHFLSHGQKKRVAIAGVLAMEPEIIILDEPTAGLDPDYTGQMMQLLADFNRSGATVVLSSHNLDEVFAWADDIFVMDSGTIIAKGMPEEVFRDQTVLQQARLTKPWVLEVYDRLVSRKIIKEQKQIPRTRQDLLKLL